MKKQETVLSTELVVVPVRRARGRRGDGSRVRLTGEPAPRSWAQGFNRPLA